MSTSSWVRVPVSPRAERWMTVPVQRRVLVVVHSVTALNRYADILDMFEADHRVQLVFTFPDASVIQGDVTTRLERAGAVTIPWEQALHTEFGLALSAHHSGNLHDINAPLVLLSHGMGYTKYSSWNQETGKGSVYGLSPHWLLHDGLTLPSALVLSHDEQLARLAELTPEALPAATVAGDPCFDRLRASTPHRSRYRAALGAGPGTMVVAVSSTWGANSLLGRQPEVIGNLLAELNVDDHLVAAILHPNIWYGHGPLQIRYWLADQLRAGLKVIPAAQGWQQAILAADVVIGDHGAVTGYAAAIGRPTLLATFPNHDVAPGTAVEALGKAAPLLDYRSPLGEQVHAAVGRQTPDSMQMVRELTSSVPDESASALRRICYRLMDLAEPAHPAVVRPYDPSGLTPEARRVAATRVHAEFTSEGRVRLERWPADVAAPHAPTRADVHLVAASDHPRRDLLTHAVILLHDGAADELANLLTHFPVCQFAVHNGGNEALIRHRHGLTLRAEVITGPGDAALGASVLYAGLTHGRPWPSTPCRVTIEHGGSQTTISFQPT